MTELPRTEEGQVALPPSPAEMGHEQTVREQMAAVLADTATVLHDDRKHDGRFEDCERWRCGWARLVLDRHRAKPEGCDAHLMETLGRLFSWNDDPKAIPIGMWAAAYNAFKAAESEPRRALERHRDEPEGTVPCERCRGTGARHLAGEPTQEPCGECSGEGVISKVTEHCGCDGPDCPTWQAGYEAQRERVEGGRA